MGYKMEIEMEIGRIQGFIGFLARGHSPCHNKVISNLPIIATITDNSNISCNIHSLCRYKLPEFPRLVASFYFDPEAKR